MALSKKAHPWFNKSYKGGGDRETTLPRRYMNVQKEISNNKNIILRLPVES